jgi:hypothetical protein
LESAIDYDRVWPERFKQLIFGKDPLPMLHEVGEKVENPWLERNLLSPQAQFTPVSIQLKILESVRHEERSNESVKDLLTNMTR